ncbi:unnamed protein product [Prunus armeniaca]|uniref:Uncharacterized protein n=1 Tax=Prunus armeniaca TaxID=36596 RepID=A0A6J5W0V0_PRUAR|nr:unnamed protein product [Prunus armeniaca]CAB4295169.1 unnamed protein product [Prunus armeniaca]
MSTTEDEKEAYSSVFTDRRKREEFIWNDRTDQNYFLTKGECQDCVNEGAESASIQVSILTPNQ